MDTNLDVVLSDVLRLLEYLRTDQLETLYYQTSAELMDRATLDSIEGLEGLEDDS